jgi:hypothetical protein
VGLRLRACLQAFCHHVCVCVCGCVVVAFRVVALTQRTTRFVLHSCYNVSMHVPAEFFSALTIVFEL